MTSQSTPGVIAVRANVILECWSEVEWSLGKVDKHMMLASGTAQLYTHTHTWHGYCRHWAYYTHTHTHPLNGPFSKTTRVSWHQKGITNLVKRLSRCSSSAQLDESVHIALALSSG